MTPVEMPKANENLTEATLEMWLVKVGDTVTKDQALCTIITDKATFEMPSPEAGTVVKILAEEKSLLPVGYVMCLLGADGEASDVDYEAQNSRIVEAHRGAVAAVTPTAGGVVASAAGVSKKVRATPAARRLAKEKGVDLAAVAECLGVSGPVNEGHINEYISKQAQ